MSIASRTRAGALALAAAALVALPAAADAQPEIEVDARKVEHPTSPLLTGVNHMFGLDNGRVPANWANGAPNEAVAGLARRVGVRPIRFPGGTQANRYDWRAGVGAQRPPCQINGAQGEGPLSNVYGFDEHMAFVARAGAQAQIMVPFASQTPADAADWVEYANDPAGGPNPNGGIAWGDRRPKPAYGVLRWEIGNEPDRPNQRYWLSRNEDEARQEYAFGKTYKVRKERADANCRWEATTTDRPGQVFRIRYAPVVADSVVVRVGDERWRKVPSLAGEGPNAKAYELDPGSGAIRFGDDRHGAIPTRNRHVKVSYHARRPGYVDYRRAMKAVDKDIQVCATWADVEFIRMMERRGKRFDCLVVHPYADIGNRGERVGPREMYKRHMVGTRKMTNEVKRLRDELCKIPAKRRPALATSEYGALAHNARVRPKDFGRSLTHALYMGSQLASWMELRLAWAEGGRLTDFVFEVIHAEDGRASLTPAGQMLELFGGMPGQPLVRTRVRGMPAPKGYPPVKVVATRDRTHLNLLLINRLPDRGLVVRLRLVGVGTRPKAVVRRLSGRSFTSTRADLKRWGTRLGPTVVLPRHSATRIRVAR